MRNFVCVGLFVFITGVLLAAEDVDASLFLDGAILSGNGSGRVLELNFRVRDGKWDARPVYGYAQFFDEWGERTSAFNAADHEGTVVAYTDSGTGLQLDIEITVNPDPWVTGGTGVYALTLTREGDAYTGLFTGTYNGQPVDGSVTGHRESRFALPVPGHVPVEPGEHPRLVFRKADLPMILDRANTTDEGQAMLARLEAVMAIPESYCNRYPSWQAAGWAFQLLLTDDPVVAETTKEVVQGVMNGDTCNTKMIRRAPRYMGIALAYDFACNYWEEHDPDFRQQVCAWLEERALEIIAGGGEGYNQHPASNWMGIAYGSLGTIAMAILGDELTYAAGTPDEWTGPVRTARRSLDIAEQGARRWLLEGMGDHGWFGEGQGYLRFSLTAGMGQFLHAYRTAMGLDAAMNGGADMILPMVMRYSLGDKNAAFGPGGWADLRFQQEERSGCWNMLMGVAPTAYLGALRWKFDQLFGLEGDQSFNIFMPYQAAYALANYPFETEPVPPAGIMPQALFDTKTGFFVLRSGWTESADLKAGSDDFISVLYMKSRRHRSTWQASPSHDFRIMGFGKQLAALPHVDADQANDLLGGTCTYYNLATDGSAVVTMDAGDAYRQNFTDAGVRATRSFGADYSGASGAPMLFAVADRITGATDPVWTVSLSGAVSIAGRTFTATHGSGTLAGTVHMPENASLQLNGDTLSVTGGNEIFVTFTVQKREAPQHIAGASGWGTVVTIGQQTVSLHEETIHFSHFLEQPAESGLAALKPAGAAPTEISFPTTTGYGYTLEASADLLDWMPVPGSRFEGSGSFIHFVLPDSDGFYRLLGKPLERLAPIR